MVGCVSPHIFLPASSTAFSLQPLSPLPILRRRFIPNPLSLLLFPLSLSLFALSLLLLLPSLFVYSALSSAHTSAFSLSYEFDIGLKFSFAIVLNRHLPLQPNSNR